MYCLTIAYEETLNMLSKMLTPPRLRPHDEDRHATWLELFFDLVLVAAIAQIGHLLVGAQTFYDGLIYAGLFALVFWVWCGHTIYSTRFDSDDPAFRLLTFLNMFTLIVMAVEVHNAAHGHGFAFGLAYLGSRLILLTLLGRAYKHVAEVRSVIKVYLVGFGVSACIWASSLFLHGPQMYWVWAIALGFDMLVPWYIWKTRYAGTTVNAEHIPERFGLFTIIVLGENIFAVVNGLENLIWNTTSLLVAALSFILAATIWWTYFRQIERATGSVELGSGQPYIYSHYPLLLGIVAVGIGTMRVIAGSGSEGVESAALAILIGGYSLWWIGGVFLHFVTCPQEAFAKTSLFRNGFIFILIVIIAIFGHGKSAIEVMSAIVALALLYAFWDGAIRRNGSKKA